MEIDISQRQINGKEVALAKTQTTCDSCGHVIGGSYPRYDTVTAQFPHESEKVADAGMESDMAFGGTKHFCGLGCTAAYIDKKDEQDGIVHEYNDDEMKKGSKQEARGEEAIGEEVLARYISTKKRNHLKSHQFVDEKRRSFPIENCKDVAAAVHAWGRYKGSMSHDEFKAKLSAKAKALGCTLPAAWTTKKGS